VACELARQGFFSAPEALAEQLFHSSSQAAMGALQAACAQQDSAAALAEQLLL
jgi:hypothetical protein